MTYTAKFHVDVKVPDSLNDAALHEIEEWAMPSAYAGAKDFLDYRDIDPANIQGVERSLRWDFDAGEVWLRSTYEVRVPKRVWQSLNGDWGG